MRLLRVGAARALLFGIGIVTAISGGAPAGAILEENSDPILMEDGSYIEEE